MVNLEANPTNFTYPFKCDFGNLLPSNEYDFYVCGMFQDARADALWRVGKGATPTLFTGPPISATATQGILKLCQICIALKHLLTFILRDICVL